MELEAQRRDKLALARLLIMLPPSVLSHIPRKSSTAERQTGGTGGRLGGGVSSGCKKERKGRNIRKASPPSVFMLTV